MKRFAFVDALRGLAIILVILHHTNLQIEGVPGLLHRLSTQGARGVQLFFVMSAFTLFLSMQSRRNEKAKMLNFLIRRFFRIAPLFYIGIIFYLIINGFQPRFGQELGVTLPSIIATATFLNGWSPYWINNVVPGGWSIAVEMMFYLMIPFLFSNIKHLLSAIMLTVVSFLGSVILYLSLEKTPLIHEIQAWKNFIFYWLPNQLPVFFLGIVLYFIFSKFQNTHNSDIASSQTFSIKRQKLGNNLLLLSGSGFIILCYLPSDPIRHFLYGIVFVCLALALILHPSRIFVNPFFCYIGKVSYSGYLSHFFVLQLVKDWVQPFLTSFSPLLQFPIVFIITLVMTMLISTISYMFIEEPSQKIGKQLIIKINKPLAHR
jgi:peptidoglycan/LPS O-acetylase OafA/YrhL